MVYHLCGWMVMVDVMVTLMWVDGCADDPFIVVGRTC